MEKRTRELVGKVVSAKNNKTITVAITNQGKISLVEYDLLQDEEGLYFEYGVNYARINVDDFEEVND